MNYINSIAQSGIEAATAKLAVTADNIANATTDGFKAARVDTTTKENGGVDVAVVKTDDQVDISKEAVEMLSTVNGFKANLQVLKADKEMTKSILDLIS
ncbi:flagellar hook protein FlgE [Geobacter sp. OR-1]|uniref:flagellar basal body protein n=1 Tax=Geobacter sp. OR-1 TaxID=1266765 RepID=UPI000541F2D3|nr:flagellar basal body protein [Geobacter sp. OR-1]GAM09966.1 flagellar hook protein FlgE [Geobacter sp. OR-1]